MSRRTLTRRQVLEWHDDWADRDRELIGAALDAIPGTNYEVPPSGGYIGVWVYDRPQSRDMHAAYLSAQWMRALIVHKGMLEWPNGRWSEGLDRRVFSDIREGEKSVFDEVSYYQWTPLSTYGRTRNAAVSKIADDLDRICPRCHLAMPAAGTCDC